MKNGQPPIQVEKLAVSYGRKRILVNADLEIRAGQLYGVLGPNGAGKSTLFKAILGLIPRDHGTVRMFGDDPDVHRKRVAYIPQKDEVDWDFPATVMDIVLMGRYPHKRLFQQIGRHDRAIALKALEDMGIANLKDRQIGALSGGQQQRVFIARALCQEADLLFLDEPFVGVDITTEHRIMQMLKKLAGQGKTILVIHHDLATVKEYFDAVVLLNQRIVAAGPVEECFTEENMAAAYGSQLSFLKKTGSQP